MSVIDEELLLILRSTRLYTGPALCIVILLNHDTGPALCIVILVSMSTGPALCIVILVTLDTGPALCIVVFVWHRAGPVYSHFSHPWHFHSENAPNGPVRSGVVRCGTPGGPMRSGAVRCGPVRLIVRPLSDSSCSNTELRHSEVSCVWWMIHLVLYFAVKTINCRLNLYLYLRTIIMPTITQ